MFTRRNSIAVPAHDVLGTRDNVLSMVYVKKLHKIFSSIQDGQYLQNFQSELRNLTADKVYDNIKISTVLKNLRNNKTTCAKKISQAQDELVTIEEVKK